MSLARLFSSIGAPAVHPGADSAAIESAESRLGGRFPADLRAWFQEADGFDGEADLCMWRFWSLRKLRPLSETFPAAREFSIAHDGRPDRRANGDHYVIICDAFICLPFYAVNIRHDSPHFSEVIYATEGSVSEAWFAAATFDEFAARLFANPEESFISAV
mgnify:CR=1 FL=1